jgi:nucleotide-binding universal stress UspA family protein
VRDSHENEVADVIAKAAGDVEADLLALGSHGRSALGGLLLGSVGRAVAQSVDCALLLARRSETPDAGTPVVQRILLAVDASSQSRVAVDAAADLASVSRAEVVAIHVLESREAAVGSPASAERLVGEAVRRLRERGVEATGSVLAGTGGVAGRIAGAADSQGADVVVIGSRRRPGPGHVMWGSTAGGLMHLTRHPILLAESPERRRLGRAGAGR